MSYSPRRVVTLSPSTSVPQTRYVSSVEVQPQYVSPAASRSVIRSSLEPQSQLIVPVVAERVLDYNNVLDQINFLRDYDALRLTDTEIEVNTRYHHVKHNQDTYIRTLAQMLQKVFEVTFSYGQVSNAERLASGPYQPDAETKLKQLQKDMIDKLINLIDMKVPSKR